jgi:hypothetical protein
MSLLLLQLHQYWSPSCRGAVAAPRWLPNLRAQKVVGSEVEIGLPGWTLRYALRPRVSGNPRNKVALKPGHSLMDWVRLGNSGVDLTGVGGVLQDVTPEQLAAHSKKNDAWIAIRGKMKAPILAMWALLQHACSALMRMHPFAACTWCPHITFLVCK